MAQRCLNGGAPSLADVHVFTHGNDRPIEASLSWGYFGRAIEQVGNRQLMHFRLEKGYAIDRKHLAMCGTMLQPQWALKKRYENLAQNLDAETDE